MLVIIIKSQLKKKNQAKKLYPYFSLLLRENKFFDFAHRTTIWLLLRDKKSYHHEFIYVFLKLITSNVKSIIVKYLELHIKLN